MKIKIIIISVITFFVLLACGGDDCGECNSPTFNDEQLVSDIITKVANPEIAKFKSDVVLLQQTALTFTTNVKKENLEEVQTIWLDVAKDWARCYTFNIGDVKDKFYLQILANFPVVTETIENKIEESSEITESTVASVSEGAKGIFGIEYLLFSADNDTVLKQFLESEKRRDFLVFMTNELVKNVTTFEQNWLNYTTVLLENKIAENNIGNSFNLIFNGVNNVIHYAWETKIGKPAGIVTSGIKPNKLEAFYSQTSLKLIEENVAITKKIFFSDEIVNISDKIKFVTKNDELNSALKSRYENIENAISVFDNSLYKELPTNYQDEASEKIKTLYNELRALEAQEFSTSVKSTLSLIITGTDGDGD